MLALTMTHDFHADTAATPQCRPPQRTQVISPERDGSDAVVIGVDYGTLSGRAVVVRVSDGQELGSAVHDYPHGVLERALPAGEPLPPEWALQVPADYIAVLQVAVPEALRMSGVEVADVIGIGTDFTACTMVATLADGTPLSRCLSSPPVLTRSSSFGATMLRSRRRTGSTTSPADAAKRGWRGTAA